MSDDQVEAAIRRLSNWGRWGADDELGTVNLITPNKRVEAAALVRTGRVFSLAIPLDESGPQPPFERRLNPRHRRARESGAELHGGGQVVLAEGLEAGNAISPAVIAGVDPAAEIAREEVFGPVATVIPFDTEEEAIALANGTPYGLSGSLWTRDVGRAVRVAREVRSGLLSINSDSSSYLEAPFGGRKQSGMGREQGLEGLHDFTELKNVYVSDV